MTDESLSFCRCVAVRPVGDGDFAGRHYGGRRDQRNRRRPLRGSLRAQGVGCAHRVSAVQRGPHTR